MMSFFLGMDTVDLLLTGSFINLTKCVKLCLKVNLRLLAKRLGGALFDVSKYLSYFLLQMNCGPFVYMSTK